VGRTAYRPRQSRPSDGIRETEAAAASFMTGTKRRSALHLLPHSRWRCEKADSWDVNGVVGYEDTEK